MKNFLLICIASLFLFACQSKNDKVQDFVKMYNRSSEMMKIPKIRSTKATSSNSEEGISRSTLPIKQVTQKAVF